MGQIPESNNSIDMIYIPGGEYKMGDKNKNSDTKVSSFWISKYEITWEVYNSFMEYERTENKEFKVANKVIYVDGISKPTEPYTDMTFGMGYEGYPAVNMTHYSATKFCKWLSLISGNYYRLPTEAEWEYACRAGSESKYYFGDNINEIDYYAWHKNNSSGKYHKVGQKKPNKYYSNNFLGTKNIVRCCNQNKVKNGRLDGDDWERFRSTVGMLQETNIYIDDTPALTPAELRARCRRISREHGLDLVVLDYLQLMQVPGSKENRNAEISEI